MTNMIYKQQSSKLKAKSLTLPFTANSYRKTRMMNQPLNFLKRINPDFTPCDNGHSEKFPYEIPETWIWCGHNSILDISGGAQPAKSYFETQPKPNYIRLYQIQGLR